MHVPNRSWVKMLFSVAVRLGTKPTTGSPLPRASSAAFIPFQNLTRPTMRPPNVTSVRVVNVAMRSQWGKNPA